MITLKQVIDLIDFGNSTYYFRCEDNVIDMLTFDLLDLQAMERLVTLKVDRSIFGIGVHKVIIHHSPIRVDFIISRVAFERLSTTYNEVKKEFQNWRWFCNSDRGKFCSLYVNLFTRYQNGSVYNVMVQDNATKHSRLIISAKVHYDDGGYFIKVKIGGNLSKLYVNRIIKDLSYPPIHC